VIQAEAAAAADRRGMGTTAVLLAVSPDAAYVAHVGDSRAYRIRDRSIECLTRDHSTVQRMVDSGMLTPEEAEDHPDRNVLYRCVGGKPDLEVEALGPIAVAPGDRFLLCSDGLHGLVENRIIATIALRNPAEIAVAHLIALANDRGGTDNISVQLLHRLGAAAPDTSVTPQDVVDLTRRQPQ
jgi:protein phosphatase